MKTHDALEILRISPRATLNRLRKRGKIKAVQLLNGRHEPDDEGVYQYLLKPIHRSRRFQKYWIESKITHEVAVLLYKTGHEVVYIGNNTMSSKNGIKLGKKTISIL